LKTIFRLALLMLPALAAHCQEALSCQWSIDALEPSSIHNGSVNVITGGYIEHAVDLATVGPDPLQLHRTISSEAWHYRTPKGWNLGSQWLIVGQRQRPRNTKDWMSLYVKLHNQYGSEIHLLPTITDGIVWNPARSLLFCNTATGELSGRTHPINVITRYHSPVRFEITKGDGHASLFTCNQDIGEKSLFDEGRQTSYRLMEERLPSGRAVLYEDDERSLYSPDRSCKLATITRTYQEDLKEVTTSDGQRVAYHIRSKRLAQVERLGAPTVSYQYLDYEKTKHFFGDRRCARITHRLLPEGRYLQTDYYHCGDNRHLGDQHVYLEKKKGASHPSCGRVARQLAPIGPDGEKMAIARYFYYYNFSGKGPERRGGTTRVLDPYDNTTQYEYDDRLRLTGKSVLDSDGHPLISTKFVYGNTYLVNEGNLLKKSIEDADGSPLSTIEYEYDRRGNVICETLRGNLTGNGDDEAWERHFVFAPDMPDYSTLSDNRTLEEIEGDRQVITSYLGDTDLPTLRLTLLTDQESNSPIHCREEFVYDDHHNLVKEIRDDGCRIITTKSYTDEGLIKTVAQLCDSGLLGKTEQIYNDRRWPIEVRHFDADGRYRFSTHTKYDDGGRPVETVDAIGTTTCYDYDVNGNLICESIPAEGVETLHTYDQMNRRTKTVYRGQGADDHEELFVYDLCGNCIEERNWLGNSTFREFDALGRVTQEWFADGAARSYRYDCLGNCTEEVDENGDATLRLFNSRGQPIQVTYPDGTSETIRYDLKGREVYRRDQIGVTYRYCYDALDRVISQEVAAPGTSLPPKTTTHSYEGDRLVSTVEPDGLTTHYGYDSAGRLISKCVGRGREEYEYDALGNLYKTKRWFGEGETDYTAVIHDFDFLGRVTEERVTGADEKRVLRRVRYEYDYAGNLTCETRWSGDGKEIKKTTAYDRFSRPVRIELWHAEDGGAVTTIEYGKTTNEQGQMVARTETTDPLGNRLVEIMDVRDRPTRLERLNASGLLLARCDYDYDGAGNLTCERHTVFSPLGVAEQTITREYGPEGRLEREVGADGKATSYSYNELGQVALKILPDEREVEYRYDGYGRLAKEECDGRYYLYDYDTADRLIASTDERGRRTSLSFDAEGYLEQEWQASGLSVRYERDRLGQQRRLHYPDGSWVKYSYKGIELSRVKRYAKTGLALYDHGYLERDLSGRLLEEQLPFKLGGRTRRWDDRGRLIRLESDTYELDLAYDLVDNLAALKGNDGTEFTHSFTYDDLYQLTGEDGIAHHRWENDSVHNQVVVDDVEGEFDLGNRLTARGTSCYEYDCLGCLRGDSEGRSYTFDYRGRLTQVVVNGIPYSYEYDSFDRRISKRCGDGQECFYLYDGLNEIAECNADGEMVALRVLGEPAAGDQGVAVAIESGSQVYVPIHNSRNDVVQLLSSDGQVLEGSRFSAFGEELDASGDGINPWRFQGKRSDPETGFVYFGGRYYCPVMSRWVSPDPLGYEEGPNLYAYVLNAPWRYADPTGMFAMPFEDLWDMTAGCAFDPEFGTFQYGGSSAEDWLGAFNGVTQTAFGMSEVAVGGALSLTPLAPLGWFLIAHGFDQSLAGAHQLVTGEHRSTLTSQLLQAGGVSPHRAELIDSGIAIFGTIGGAGALRIGQPGLRVKLGQPGKVFAEPQCPKQMQTRATTDIVAGSDGLVHVRTTIDRINRGGVFPHRNDGSIFLNREGLLPKRPAGYYREFVHPTPGMHVGKQRIVQGSSGELYYTADHYKSFLPIN